ncbi:MAG: hypothetical protein ABSC08_04190, partial [Bryobacteraceae bacterium]
MNGLSEPLPWMNRVEEGEEVPMPSSRLLLFQNRLPLFWLSNPPSPAKGMEPWVRDEKVGAWLTVRLAMVVVAKVD